jgi:integrase
MAKERPGPRAYDMADIVELMLATGGRIGEVIGPKGKGTYRKATPKSDSSRRTVALPDFAMEILRRRRTNERSSAIDAVFPTRNDTWQQVTNVERRWRQDRKDTEFYIAKPAIAANVAHVLQQLSGDDES